MAATSQIKSLFEDYDGFVEKFKPKKTTDDCMTPPAVYEAVKGWVDRNIMPLDGVEVVRPFWPGGDYESFVYPEGCVVLDNPPFSIVSRICRFYNDRKIRYFLFAPGLTLFGWNEMETYIITGTPIIYENGATVGTGFRTNLTGGDPKVWVSGDLDKTIKDACASMKTTKKLRKIELSPYVITSARLQKIAKRGISVSFRAKDLHFIRKLDNSKGGLYGAGFLLSEAAAAEMAAAKMAAAKVAAAAEVEVEILSAREWEIIRGLG